MKKYFFKIFIIFNLIINSHEILSKNILIIDTYANNKYAYNKFTELATNAGFQINYKNFYDLLNFEILDYEGIFLLISPDFIKNLNNIIVKNVIRKVNDYSMMQGKIIALILPNNTFRQAEFLNTKKLIQRLNLLNSKSRSSLKNIINYFLQLNFVKNHNYSTAIEFIEKTKKPEELKLEEQKLKEKQEIKTIITDKEDKLIAALLPMHDKFSDILKALPFGLYIKNPINNNHIFISKMPIFFFSEISENFFLNPIDKNIRNKLLSTLQQTLLELRLLSENKNIQEIKSIKNICEINNINIQNKNTNKLFCGWLDLDAYDENFMDKGINNIIQANLDILWIRFNPELYFSKNAIHADKKQQYLDQINKFTKALIEKCNSLSKKVPKIFIGAEITGNYKNIVLNDYMKDIYNQNYTKIPVPLDFENFWKKELLNVFDEFCENWNLVGNGLNIDGIFLDFEMYHAQNQASEFLQLSDFSNISWNLYLEKTGKNIDLQDTKNRISCLYKTHELNNYFSFLQMQAYDLGSKIRAHLKSKLPNIIIGAYLPNIPTEWFYLGILGGLSTKEDPIILATFNNDFLSHKNWLEENNIYCLHLTAILLSKFKNQESFALINDLKEGHDGIWFNRFSRLGHNYDQDKWWANESTPFDHDTIVKEIGNHH